MGFTGGGVSGSGLGPVEHSGNNRGKNLRGDSGNIRGALKKTFGDSWGTFGDIRGRFGEHSGNIRGKFRQKTFGKTWNIRGELGAKRSGSVGGERSGRVGEHSGSRRTVGERLKHFGSKTLGAAGGAWGGGSIWGGWRGAFREEGVLWAAGRTTGTRCC